SSKGGNDSSKGGNGSSKDGNGSSKGGNDSSKGGNEIANEIIAFLYCKYFNSKINNCLFNHKFQDLIMANGEVKRNYNMTDAELCMFTSHLCLTLTRDLADLTEFGITAAKISALKALGDAFEVTQTDDYYRGEKRVSTEEKTAKEEVVMDYMRKMGMRAALKWGVKSSKYARLGIEGLAKFKEDKLLLKARDIHTFLTENLADLADVGLTQAMLDDFATANNDLEGARNAQLNAIENRDLSTSTREIKGNEIYELVSKYCEIGKKLYFNSNPAKYNDYIIYQKEAGGLSVPTNFFFNFMNLTFYWDVVNHATSYQLERKHGNEYVQIYAGKDPEFQFTPPDGQGFYRVRARNMNGFGPSTEDLEQWYFAVLPPASNLVINDTEMNPGQYRLTWTAVPTATEYSVYRSVVENGQPFADFSLQGKTAEPNFVINVESGKRNYFRVNTKNQSQYALPSSPVWIEV
ncbi:MAG TPA: hypothetical protein PK762_00900, partial [Candidatus Kapabacteria bacterium]|nr:hypothetical protein [Candidatus Kapabacteria bacterium]